MTIGSLFSGIGGLELGLERAGHGPVKWQVEIDPFARDVLTKHWPEVPKHEDVRAVGAAVLEPVGIICGGFPCQDVSQLRAKDGWQRLEDTDKSGLWFEFQRIVGELRPPVVVVENVASGKQRWLPEVRRGLHLLGYRSRAFRLSAAEVGAPHGRPRIFVIAHPDGKSEPVSAVAGQVAWDAPTPGVVWDGWESPPQDLRVDDGVPGWLDRVRCLGNAVVPQCAEVIGRMIARSA